MIIRLTETEMLVAGILGSERHRLSANRKTTRGQPVETSLDSHTVGAYGEIATAKALGLYPGFTVNNFDGPDIEPNIQVRSARKGKLILTDRDNPFQIYVLVLGIAPDLDVAGWVWGYEGQDKKWLFDPNNNRPPAYFVPAKVLRSIETIHEN